MKIFKYAKNYQKITKTIETIEIKKTNDLKARIFPTLFTRKWCSFSNKNIEFDKILKFKNWANMVVLEIELNSRSSNFERLTSDVWIS